MLRGFPQSLQTRPIQPAARVVLPVRKDLSTLPMAKPRLEAEAILKTYIPFICGDIHYITNVFCKNVGNFTFFIKFPICLLIYLLTPWSRVLLEKLTGSAASQEIPLIFGTRKLITVFTSARHLSLS